MKIIAMGSAALMDGFSLLGIKTYADESTEVINQVLTDLKREHERALIFIQQDLMQADIPMVNRLRNRGGTILLCEIPLLHEAENFQPEVENLVSRVMGGSILESQDGH